MTRAARRWVRAWIGCVSAAALAGCASAPASQDPSSWVTLETAGPAFGETSTRLSECASGQHEEFRGADFTGSEGLAVRLVIDPLSGPGLRVFDPRDPFRRAVVFREGDCERFRFSLANNGWTVNDIYILKVTLDVDCTLPSGDRVRIEGLSATCG